MSLTKRKCFTTKLSVVLGTYNRKSLLKKAVESIETNNIRIPYEVIVIDGGSDDGTIEWLFKQKNIITIIQHNHGEWNGQKLVRKSWGSLPACRLRTARPASPPSPSPPERTTLLPGRRCCATTTLRSPAASARTRARCGASA